MYTKIIIIMISTSFALYGCAQSAPKVPSQQIVIEVQEANISGTVTEPWVEPMHDTIKVHGQLDPTGTYYRAKHRTVVEIRPGKYQEVDYGK